MNHVTMTPFEKFKEKEFKGDLLLTLIVCDILMRNGIDRRIVRNVERHITCNAYLASIFDQLQLKIDKDDISVFATEYKQRANVVEVHIWNYFNIHGYENTVSYFSQFVKL